MADRRGRIWASVPGLANRARVPLADTEKALETFLGPDRYSRTPDNEGRRIEPIDGGWQLLNHAKYRDMRDEEVRREQNREAKQRERSAKVLTVSHGQPQSAQAEADTEADTDSKEKVKTIVGLKPDPARLEQKKALAKEAVELLTFFNRKAGKNFPADKHNIGLIAGLLSAGHPSEKIRMVVAKKVTEWSGDPEMVKYLRPATLFGPKNFATKYVGEIPA